MVDLSIKQYKVTKICQELGIEPPFITIVDEHLEEGGKTVFARTFNYSVVSIYRGSFDAAYRGALEIAGELVTSQGLLATFSKEASRVLLEEIWHCKQFEDGQHLVLPKDVAEAEASAWSHTNVDVWPDLVAIADE